MKSIIIAGVPRSGKSTLARQLSQKLQYTYVPFDSITSTLQQLYPHLGISHYDDVANVSSKIAIFLGEFLKHLRYEHINAIIDVYQLYPSDIREHILIGRVEIIYMGYTEISAKEKLHRIRKYSKSNDWTKSLPDQQLIDLIERYISESKFIQEQCRLHRIPFFDSGSGFTKTIDSALEFLQQSDPI